MRRLFSTITLTAGFALAMIFTISCNATGNPSALVGRWIGVSGDEKGLVVELLSDGTGIYTKNSVGVPITWKTEKDRFYSTVSGLAGAWNYKLQGSLLTFTEDNGKINEWTKCKQDCQEAVKEYVKAKFTGVKKGSFTDSRDGKSYKTLTIGNQTWMAENLNYNANGKCYENSESNCQKYGKLYNWETALNACPKGWHLPSEAEWGTLVDLAGGRDDAGNLLKSANGWKNNGINAVGFSALPGGDGDSNGNFYKIGEFGYWWSAKEYNASDAYFLGMSGSAGGVGWYYGYKTDLSSVRCVQD